ncbi:MAG: hypothetical protein ACLTHQ_06845 [Odoribacter splanchnicus]
MKISEYYTPQWSADGKSCFSVSLRNGIREVPAEVTADVDIWHWKDQEIQSRQKNRYYLNRSRTYLCVWWPEENRWRQLADSSLFDIAVFLPTERLFWLSTIGPIGPITANFIGIFM